LAEGKGSRRCLSELRKQRHMVRAIVPRHYPWLDFARSTFSLGVTLGGGAAILSGHTASEYDPELHRIVVRGSLEEQTRTTFKKVQAVLEEAGLTLADVVQVVEYVCAGPTERYFEMESLCAEILVASRPIVNTVVVSSLVRSDALIEIEVVANGRASPNPISQLVFLPSLRAPMAGDFHSQAAAVVERADKLLRDLGLSLNNITRCLQLCVVDAIANEPSRQFVPELMPETAASTLLYVKRLPDPTALFQADLIASRHPLGTSDGHASTTSGLTFFSQMAPGSGPNVSDQATRIYSDLLRAISSRGNANRKVIKTVEYITPVAVDGYRSVSDIRRQLLPMPFPVATGVVVEALSDPAAQICVEAWATGQ